MHEPGVAVSRFLKVPSKRERCILGVCGFRKACDTIELHGMWQRLRVYGVGAELLKAVQSF